MDIYKFLIQKSPLIKKVFLALEILYALFIAILLFSNNFIPSQYTRYIGMLTLLVFMIVLTPGTVRRFGIKSRFADLLMVYRRNFGIFTYMLILTHELTYYSGQVVLGPNLFLKAPDFIKMGMTASILLLPLFLTSNDFAVRILKKWWKRLHKLIYVAVLFIYLHLLFQKSPFAIVLLIWMLINLLAILYRDLVKKS